MDYMSAASVDLSCSLMRAIMVMHEGHLARGLNRGLILRGGVWEHTLGLMRRDTGQQGEMVFVESALG